MAARVGSSTAKSPDRMPAAITSRTPALVVPAVVDDARAVLLGESREIPQAHEVLDVVRGEEPEMDLDELRQPTGRCPRTVEHEHVLLDGHLGHPQRDRIEDVLLRPEVVVQARTLDPDRLGDAPHPRRVVPDLGEVLGGGDDLVPTIARTHQSADAGVRRRFRPGRHVVVVHA